MHTWQYPEAVQAVEQACQAYLTRQAGIEHLQAVLREAEQEIVALDEAWLRAALFDAENKLEAILFTVPIEQRAAAGDAVAHHVLQTIQARSG